MSNDAFENQKFKKGQSGNPDGAKLHDRIPGEIKRLASKEVEEIGALILNGDTHQIKQIASDDSAPVLKRWIATVVVKALAKGDYKALDAILDRMVGKVKQVHAIGQDPNAGQVFLPAQVVLTLPDNGRSVKKPEAPKK